MIKSKQPKITPKTAPKKKPKTKPILISKTPKPHKQPPPSCDNYLLVNGKIYRVDTPSDRLKLFSFENVTGSPDKLDSQQYRDPSTSGGKPSFHQRERSLEECIASLSTTEKQALLRKLQAEIKKQQLAKALQSIGTQLDAISPQKETQEEQEEEQHKQEESKEAEPQDKKPPFVIPPIITPDKREQIEKEKNIALQKQAEATLQRRIALQLGYIPADEGPVRTSLPAVGWYLQSITSYILKNYMEQVLDLINTPFGKSAAQKLGYMRQQNRPEEMFDLPFILSEDLFQEFQQYRHEHMQTAAEGYEELEKAHCKAIFDALNHVINIYRPYFSFDGEILPWLVTEKGMTFYSINQDNIEEVFEKSKVKILETAASLCGIHTEADIEPAAVEIYDKRREAMLKRVMDSEQHQQSDNWLGLSTQEAKLRLSMSDDVLEYLIQETAHQLTHLKQG